MYWSDINADTIERVSMDGTSRTVLHSTGLGRAYGITLDYVTQTLYWIDYDFDTIESSRTDGSNRRLLTRVSSRQCPYALTIFDQKLYWADHCYQRIYSTFVNSPNSGNRILSAGTVHRLHVVTQERQPIIGNCITPCS